MPSKFGPSRTRTSSEATTGFFPAQRTRIKASFKPPKRVSVRNYIASGLRLYWPPAWDSHRTNPSLPTIWPTSHSLGQFPRLRAIWGWGPSCLKPNISALISWTAVYRRRVIFLILSSAHLSPRWVSEPSTVIRPAAFPSVSHRSSTGSREILDPYPRSVLYLGVPPLLVRSPLLCEHPNHVWPSGTAMV